MDREISLTLECDGLPEDAIVTAATVLEALSRPTHATVEVLTRGDLDFDAPVGQKVHLAIAVDGEPVRHFHLVVAALRFEGMHRASFRRFVFELTHELSLLLYRSDVRMFQDKDAQEIVAAVLDAAGVPAADVTFSLQRTPGKRVYCIQYRETDLDFVSRLLEHEGIFYFAHDDDGGTHVTFADAQSAFTPIAGDPCQVVDGRAHGEGVRDFWLEDRAASGIAVVSDYNFETPQLDLTASHQGNAAQGEVFEYAAGHRTPAEAATFAKIRCEELRARSRIATGASTRWAFQAGSIFELQGAHAAYLNQKYLLTAVTHRIVAHAEESGEQGVYDNTFTGIPASVPFRPPRTARRPRLRGAHAAVVTGPGGEIHTDEYGRMKGKFFWDRVGASDDTSSCWMRVTQLPVSGSMALARMTWEMGIVYFDGDPDRPIAFSRLYNAEKTSPYGYPAAKTRMSLQTPSSPASGKSNEIRLEDSGGAQEFFVNASKDYDGVVLHNKTEDVGVDESIEVGVDARETIGANQTLEIGANQTANVASNQGIGITGTRSVSIGGSETVTVSGNITQGVKGSDSETTAGSHTSLAALGVDKTAKGSFSVSVGGSMMQASALGVAVAVAGAKSETVAAAKIFASGKAVTESVVGAYACTVGGALVQAAAGNRVAGTKGAAAITVGGLVSATAGGKVAIKGKKINIVVGGVANLLGGGGVVNLTPGSASFAGLVMLDASGAITIAGNPNFVG